MTAHFEISSKHESEDLILQYWEITGIRIRELWKGRLEKKKKDPLDLLNSNMYRTSVAHASAYVMCFPPK